MIRSGGLVDPAVAAFKACMDEEARVAPEDSYKPERIRRIVSFFEAIHTLYNKLRRLPNGPIQEPYKITAKIREEFG